jgi:hypothetical protein
MLRMGDNRWREGKKKWKIRNEVGKGSENSDEAESPIISRRSKPENMAESDRVPVPGVLVGNMDGWMNRWM